MNPVGDLEVNIEVDLFADDTTQCECVDERGNDWFHAMLHSPAINWNDPAFHRCQKEAKWVVTLTFRSDAGDSIMDHFMCEACFDAWKQQAMGYRPL